MRSVKSRQPAVPYHSCAPFEVEDYPTLLVRKARPPQVCYFNGVNSWDAVTGTQCRPHEKDKGWIADEKHRSDLPIKGKPLKGYRALIRSYLSGADFGIMWLKAFGAQIAFYRLAHGVVELHGSDPQEPVRFRLR